MPDHEEPTVVPMDPAIRHVLDEFDHDPIALANEIVILRQELWHRAATSRPTIIERPAPPPDAAPPIQLSPQL